MRYFPLLSAAVRRAGASLGRIGARFTCVAAGLGALALLTVSATDAQAQAQTPFAACTSTMYL
ncbi:hypothetical protein, partial [Nitratireductor sp. GCM10026969]|uniref:hypothetical protein n=1 Tax=Nitratireductor sp. GCM10026969 TaxID=3252645 RepID=UPI003612FFE1